MVAEIVEERVRKILDNWRASSPPIIYRKKKKGVIRDRPCVAA